MYAKLFVTVLAATALGAGLLGLRQQRLQTMHEMAELHADMDRPRRDTWDLQIEIGEKIEPDRLREAIDRNQLVMEPSTRAPDSADLPPSQFVQGPVRRE